MRRSPVSALATAPLLALPVTSPFRRLALPRPVPFPSRLLALLLITIGLLGAYPGRAGADVFGSTSLVSASPFGQAEFAHDPALSEDGRYVVFDGSIGGVAGVWRRRTAPGSSFEQVAGGDAALPSVSADGRYVSFTTNEGAGLTAITDGRAHGEAVQEAPGVYVRDMSRAPAEAGAFTLASAKDHSGQSLSYDYTNLPENEQVNAPTTLGATAAGRSAITADGRTVAFVTTAPSDLAGPGTPPLQVAVRHLDTQETQLVSVRYDRATGLAAVNPETGGPEPVAYVEGHGAVWSSGKLSSAAFSPSGPALALAYAVPQVPGASISADGTAVAWLGQRVPEQARVLSGEEEMPQRYAEPMWRRIGAGPLAPTRRVTGGSDPEAAGCIAHPESALPSPPSVSDPCQGPFATQNSGGYGTWNDTTPGDVIPRLSANGDDVAFIASVALTREAGGFPIGGSEYNSDAYWVDMTAPDRTSALRELTHFASAEQNRTATNANIDDIAISPDGQQVAFTTKRTVFPLGVPAYVSAPAAVPGLAEVYEADLANNTLTRVTQGYEGGAPQHPEHESAEEDRYARVADGALSPSFSRGAEQLAFSSTAANLVFGDGNTPAVGSQSDFADGADAFVVPRILFSTEPTPQSISAAPPNPAPEPPWRLSVNASSLASGAVLLSARLPTGGTLAVRASSGLPAGAARRHRKVNRTVAKAIATAPGGTAKLVKLQLTLSTPYRSLADRSGGLPSTVAVTFSAPGHPTLKATLAVRFVHRGRHHAKRRHR